MLGEITTADNSTLPMEKIMLSLGKHPGSPPVVSVEMQPRSLDHYSDGPQEQADVHSDGMERSFDSSDLRLQLEASMHANGAYFGDQEYIEFDVNSSAHPRLKSPFYQHLRQRFPKAFRRRTSVNCSETSSVCGDVETSFHGSSPRALLEIQHGPKKNHGTQREGLPPLPPGRCRKQSDESMDNGDLTIVGVSRRTHINKEHSDLTQDALRQWNGTQYSSTCTLSLQSAKSQPLHRTDSMKSLRERLEQNQECWRMLLSDTCIPFTFQKHKDLQHGSHAGNNLRMDENENTKYNAPSENGHDVPLAKSNTAIAIPPKGGLVVQPTSESCPEPPVRHRNRNRRFASPDSSHDSAVDVDISSVQSIETSPDKTPVAHYGIHTTSVAHNGSQCSSPQSGINCPSVNSNVHNPQQPAHQAEKPASRPPLPVRPPRSRTPKLKSGRASPLILQAQKQRALSPEPSSGLSSVRAFSPPPVGLGEANNSVTTCQISDLPGFTGHLRDSDADSGIVHVGVLGSATYSHGSSTDDDMEEHLNHRRHHTSKPGVLSPALSPRDSLSSLLKATQCSSNPVSPRHTASQCLFGISENTDKRPLGVGLNSHLSGSDMSLAPSATKQSSSDRKRERVKFEDEVPLSQRQRAASQPALNLRPILQLNERLVPGVAHTSEENSINGSSIFHSQSDENIYSAINQSSKKDDVKKKSRSETPSQMLLKTALSEEHLDANMETHRASPVIIGNNQMTQKPTVAAKPKLQILPPPKPKVDITDSNVSDQWSCSDMSLCSVGLSDAEMSMSSKTGKKKKSKLPWKKNKGRFNPSQETEKIQANVLKKSPSWGSLTTDVHGQPQNTDSNDHMSQSNAKPPPVPIKPQLPSKPKLPAYKSSKDNVPSTSTPCHKPPPAPKPKHLPTPTSVSSPSSGTDPECVDTSVVEERIYDEVYNESILEQQDCEFEDSFDDYDSTSEEDEPYAQVDFSQKIKTEKPVQQNPGISFLPDETIDQLDGPPLPNRNYESNLHQSKQLSGSRSSLFNRMDSLKQSARRKFGQLRKAVSLERLSGERRGSTASSIEGNTEFVMKKSPSLRSLTEALKFRKKDKPIRSTETQNHLRPEHRKPPRPTISAPILSRHGGSLADRDAVDTPKNFRSIGKLKCVHNDGSQTIELTKPLHGPFGFYIARGNAKYQHGIFISRLTDGLPEHFFAGLLSVGDELLEINQQPVDGLAMDAVYDLMGQNDHLTLHTLPYALRSQRET